MTEQRKSTLQWDAGYIHMSMPISRFDDKGRFVGHAYEFTDYDNNGRVIKKRTVEPLVRIVYNG